MKSVTFAENLCNNQIKDAAEAYYKEVVENLNSIK